MSRRLTALGRMSDRLDELKAEVIRNERHFNQEMIELVYITKCLVQLSGQQSKSRSATIAMTVEQVKRSSDQLLVSLEEHWNRTSSLDRFFKSLRSQIQCQSEDLLTYCAHLQELQNILSGAGGHNSSVQQSVISAKFRLDRTVLPLCRLKDIVDLLEEMKYLLEKSSRRVELYHCNQCLESVTQVYARCQKVLASVSGDAYVDSLETAMKEAKNQTTSLAEIGSSTTSNIKPALPKKPLLFFQKLNVHLESNFNDPVLNEKSTIGKTKIVSQTLNCYGSASSNITVYPEKDISDSSGDRKFIFLERRGNVVPSERRFTSKAEFTLKKTSPKLKRSSSDNYFDVQRRLKEDVDTLQRRLLEVKDGVQRVEEKLQNQSPMEGSIQDGNINLMEIPTKNENGMNSILQYRSSLQDISWQLKKVVSEMEKEFSFGDIERNNCRVLLQSTEQKKIEESQNVRDTKASNIDACVRQNSRKNSMENDISFDNSEDSSPNNKECGVDWRKCPNEINSIKGNFEESICPTVEYNSSHVSVERDTCLEGNNVDISLNNNVILASKEYPKNLEDDSKMKSTFLDDQENESIFETVKFKKGKGTILEKKFLQRSHSDVNFTQFRNRKTRKLLRNSMRSLPMYQSYYEECDPKSPRFARRSHSNISRKRIGEGNLPAANSIQEDLENSCDRNEVGSVEQVDSDSDYLNINKLQDGDEESGYKSMINLFVNSETETEEEFSDFDENIYESVHDLTQIEEKEEVEEEEETEPVEVKLEVRGAPTRKSNQLMIFGWCQLPQVVRHGLVDKLTKNEICLQEAKYEIISSKVSYLKSLSVLQTVFVDSPELRVKMPVKDFDSLFQFVAPLKRCTECFLTDLLGCWPRDLFMKNMQAVIHEYAEQGMLQIYVDFCSNKVYMDATLRSIRNLKPKLNAVICSLEDDEMCDKHTLESFLLLPVQRITRFPLLVDAVIKRLESGSEEHTRWLATRQLLHSVAKECDSAIGVPIKAATLNNKDLSGKRSPDPQSTFYVSLKSANSLDAKSLSFFPNDIKTLSRLGHSESEA